MDKYAVCQGDIVQGFWFNGPFDDISDAKTWIEKNCTESDHAKIVTLYSIEVDMEDFS